MYINLPTWDLADLKKQSRKRIISHLPDSSSFVLGYTLLWIHPGEEIINSIKGLRLYFLKIPQIST
jgi:hypothetical protein